ncbi:MAG: hypothetical protein JO027_17925 [Solirubrobacterales bacterium]|nr:hypothetical protein [Solirubrobacterales bacterium]
MTASAPAHPPITPQLADTGIVAILRADRQEHLPAVTETLAEAGIRCLELTMTTPGALEALRRLRPQLEISTWYIGELASSTLAIVRSLAPSDSISFGLF